MITPPTTVAFPTAFAPMPCPGSTPPPANETTGFGEYPPPPFAMATLPTLSPFMTAVALAPVPLASTITTVGTEV